MTAHRRTAASRCPLAGAVATAVLALGLAACETPPSPPVADRYGIEVDIRTFQASVHVGARAELPADFVTEYRRRGRGAMLLTAPPTPEGERTARRLKRWLADQAIKADIITGYRPEAAVQASFPAAVAAVPECGNWSDGDTYNPNRMKPLNFGCAYQRNIGLMLADPGDLQQAEPMGRPRAPRQVDIVETYRRGEPTATMPPAEEGRPASDITE
ncbi:CpaD family pilus assembly lipoprotein [Caenispirillum salinarum]|uniref:CpaD family pilus assembly lipoprotein n=1 Tax=Caenispirillum salinarum TaxID=859058 RepID=UPI00384C7460